MNKTNKYLILFLVLGFFANRAHAQVKVGDNPTTIDNSAVLEVESTTKGLLTPRMTAAQRTAITSPANGLLVYQTDGAAGFYFYDGTSWKPFGYAKFVDGTNTADAVYTIGNVGIGTTTPNASAILDITSTTKGFLIPRLTTSEMNAISNPANGLGVWNTTAGGDLLFNLGTPAAPRWGTSWNINAGYSLMTDFLMGFRTNGGGFFSSSGLFFSGTGPSGFTYGNAWNGTPLGSNGGYFFTDGGRFAISTFLPGSGNASYAKQNAFVVANNGNVGIGAGTPSAALHIIKDANSVLTEPFGDFQNNGQLFIASQTAPAKRLALGIDHINNVGVIQSINSGLNALPMALNPTGGNVGIRNTNPDYALDVTGRSRIRSGNGSAGIWYMNAANTANTAFIGMNNDNTVGFFGQTLGGFGLLMNVATGNVGIGTATPSQKLDVIGNSFLNGKVYLQQSGNDANATTPWYGFGVDGFVVNYGAFDGHAFHTATSSTAPAMFVAGNSNVGIGTTTPRSALHIIRDANSVLTEPFGDFQNNGQLFIASQTSPTKRLALGIDHINDVGVIQSVNSGTIVLPMALNPTGGNVGIGITTPSQKLQVEGNSFLNGKVYLQQSGNDANTTTPWYGFGVNGTVVNYGAFGGHAFYTANSSTTPAMIVAGNSNVGIGTTAPESNLHLYKNDVISYPMLLIEDGTAGGNKWGIIATGNSWGTNANQFSIGNVTTGGWQFNIKNNGDVGIGWSTPTAKLHVNGYIKVGSSDATADAAPTAGLIRFNSGTGKFQGYDGSAWVDLN